MNKGKLIVTGTPIGNISDISYRAASALVNAKYIACEDSRRAGLLLQLLHERLGLERVEKPQYISYRDQNHIQASARILDVLESGEDVLLISDSGMPTISDPGYKLVNELKEAEYEVDTYPGPTAVTTALAISGLPTDQFYFLGFLPRQATKMKSILESSMSLPATTIAYESPIRLGKALGIIAEVDADRLVSVVCELTKLNQRSYLGSAAELAKQFKSQKVKGECVILISKASRN